MKSTIDFINHTMEATVCETNEELQAAQVIAKLTAEIEHIGKTCLIAKDMCENCPKKEVREHFWTFDPTGEITEVSKERFRELYPDELSSLENDVINPEIPI